MDLLLVFFFCLCNLVEIILFLFICIGKHPFFNEKKKFQLGRVLSGKYDKLETTEISNEIKDLIYKMMDKVCIKLYLYIYYLFRIQKAVQHLKKY
jgi:hypothetical protein